MIENYRWHDNRHIFCSQLTMLGKALEVIQELAAQGNPDDRKVRASCGRNHEFCSGRADLLRSSACHLCRMVSAREALQIRDRNQNPRSDPASGEMFIGYQVIQRPLADGEHVGSLMSADQQLGFGRSRGSAGALSFANGID
jgi:hypothetical protein